MSALDNLRNWFKNGVLIGALATSAHAAEMTPQENHPDEPAAPNTEQTLSEEDIEDILPEGLRKVTPSDINKILPEGLRKADIFNEESIQKRMDSLKTTSLLWETYELNKQGVLEKKSRINDYATDLNIFLLSKDNKLIRTTLHGDHENLPDWSQAPLHALQKQLKDIENHPEWNVLSSYLRQRGISPIISEKMGRLGAELIGYLTDTRYAEDELTGGYFLPRSGLERVFKKHGVNITCPNDIINYANNLGEEDNYNLQYAVLHESMHLIDRTALNDGAFSSSDEFKACCQLDLGAGGKDSFAYKYDLWMKAQIADHNSNYDESIYYTELLAYLSQDRFAHPEEFKKQCPYLDAYISKVILQSVKTQVMARQMGDESADYAIEEAQNLPELSRFRKKLIERMTDRHSVISWAHSLYDADYAGDKKRVAELQESIRSLGDGLMEGMDSFQKNMKDTRHVLWANHPEYTGEVKSAKVAQAEIADLTAKLTGMNVIEEMHERPMAFLAMLDSFPDLGAVRGTSPHLNNEIINLTKNQEWWKEFCAQAWMNGENSFYFQAIKDLAKKQVPQALLFIGQHALEQNNDPATAWHCLTTAQNGPYKAVLKVGYATETTSLLTDLNRNPSALMAALGNASAKGSVEAIAQTQSHQPTAITVKNPTVNPLLKDGKASASVTSPNTPAPPIQPVQNR